MKRTLLLSGGMDSLAVAWWLRPSTAITIDYGQLAASAEIEAAMHICADLSIEHHVICVDCGNLGSGDMAGLSPNSLAPATDWWPYRNQLILTLAAMKSICSGATTLLLGTVRSDASHQDGTENFVRAMAAIFKMQEGNLTVEAPAISMTTAQLVREAQVPLSMLSWAHSCHRSPVTCGSCRGCSKYFEVMQELTNGLD